MIFSAVKRLREIINFVRMPGQFGQLVVVVVTKLELRSTRNEILACAVLTSSVITVT